MENNPYNLHNLPRIMRSVRKAAGLAQYQIGNLIGEKISGMFRTLKMDSVSLPRNYASSGLRRARHTNILIWYITSSNCTRRPRRQLIQHLTSASAAVINMIHQLEEALQATRHLARWLANDSRQPEELPMVDIKQIFDLIPANKTLIYSLRSHGLNMKELVERWTRKALMSQVAMAKTEERQAVLV